MKSGPVTLKDIYDVVNRLEDKLNVEIKDIRTDVEELQANQNKQTGFMSILTVFISTVVGTITSIVIGSRFGK